MKKFSEQLFHLGFSFLSLPGIAITNQTSLKFQQELNAHGLDFAKVDKTLDNRGMAIGLTVIRESPSPLHIVVNMHQAPAAQLIVLAPNPKTTKDLFIDETEAVIGAYEATWPANTRQYVHSDGAIRELLEASADVAHAFQELWEKRLKQPIESLMIFGKPIRGGGLRFVLDPVQGDPDPVQIEIKIESYLQDTKKIFVETLFNWFTQANTITPRERINYMDSYVKDRVHKFILGETENDQ